jgi:hypothetical protein
MFPSKGLAVMTSKDTSFSSQMTLGVPKFQETLINQEITTYNVIVQIAVRDKEKHRRVDS